jgi:hypothetical protein
MTALIIAGIALVLLVLGVVAAAILQGARVERWER